MSSSRFLVTTADERTWKWDRPVLFLGEWCRLYERRHHWEAMDGIVASPYDFKSALKDNAGIEVKKIFDNLLIKLRDTLNAYHKIDKSSRYWRILLGHWLQRYVSVLFNRWHTIKQVLETYKMSGAIVLESAAYSLATLDSNSFIWACNDNVWNHVLYTKILNYFSDKNFKTEKINCDIGSRFNLPTQRGKPKNRIKSLISQISQNILPVFSGERDAFIIGSYLPKAEEIKLNLMLGQVPQLWRSPNLVVVEPNLVLREKLALYSNNKQEFYGFACDMFREMLPTCYLEGYQLLLQQVNGLPWPRKPKFIFTSNNFDTDEIFKVWTAKKVLEEVPYYTGQHGNNYGTLKNCPSERECVATSDRFITWGWADGNPKHAPGFLFKYSLKTKKKIKDKDGGLLLIEGDTPHRINFYDDYSEFGTWQEEQFVFVRGLLNKIQEKLIVRLHASQKLSFWSDELRWKDRFSFIKLEKGSISIEKLIKQSRLVVHSYDSTGILETLALDIPTLAFWQNGLEHLRESAKPYYQLLVDAQIIHLSPESAARKINEIWEDVDNWWQSQEVQKARQIFCDRYARIEKKPIRKLKQLLLDTNF
jgi:putative transferase (TIGR04331 family)